MSGASEINIENVLRNSVRNGAGFIEDIDLNIMQGFCLLGRAIIPNTGSNLVIKAATATNMDVLAWSGTAAAATQRVTRTFALPCTFKPGFDRVGDRPRIQIVVRARAYASVPGGQAIQCDAWWQNPNIADPTLVESDGDTALQTITTIDGTLTAAAAASNVEKFREITFDLTNAMTTAQRNALRPGATFRVVLGPKINLTTETIEVASAVLRIVRHSAPWNTGLRSL